MYLHFQKRESVIMAQQKKSLRDKVLRLLGLVLFCPVIIITAVIVTIGYRSIHKSMFNQQVEIANSINYRVASYIESGMGLAENILEVSQQLSTGELVSLFKYILRTNSNVSEIIMLSTNGAEKLKVSMQGGKPFVDKKLINRLDTDEFKRAVYRGGCISKVYFSNDRQPYIFVGRRKKENVLMLKMSINNIWKIISDIKIGNNGYAFIVNEDGLLIAHPENARVIAHTDFSNLSIVKDFMNKKKINIWRTYRSESGAKVVSVYSRIPRLNWAVITQIPREEVLVPTNNMIIQAVILSAIFSIIFFYVGFRFVNGLLNPLRQLIKAAGYISKGKYDVHFNIKSNDEIEDLANTFVSMGESLRQLEELRQDLISMIVHDMKSPLSGITGGLDYLSKCDPASEEYQQIISIVKSSANSLLGLIQNLVDISRMEEGKLNLKLAPTEMENLLKDVTEQFKVLTKAEDKELTVEFAKQLPVINVDTELIVRVVHNLLTNALHHTTLGGKIWFKVDRADEKNIRVMVSDNGVGIPEEYKDKIFEKFVQVERKRARLRTGTGLGLTFCKMAIELHEGKIWVESEQGKGSSFIFLLPIENRQV